MKEKKVILTEKELEIFSNELLSDFQMMESYAGGAAPKSDCGDTYVSPDADGCNGNCHCGINFWCGDTCVVKAWFNCH